MIRVSVLSKNDLYKFFFKTSSVLILLFGVIKVYGYSKNNLSNKKISIEQGISYLAEEIASMSKQEKHSSINIDSNEIIGSELRASRAVTSRGTESTSSNLINDNADIDNNQIDEDVQEVADTLPTEVVKNSVKDTYNFEIGSVKIKNETKYDLASMNLDQNINIKNKNIIIYHTHTCESYTPTAENNYNPSGNYRTTDLNYSVAKVGDELEKYLNNYGFNVIHDKTYHDYPAYTGSYGRSLTTVQNILAECDKTDIIIDLHRDAIGDESFAPKVKIGNEYAAQIMFVIGTDGSGLEHPNWKHNLEFAIKVQEKANEMYPGLFKAILVRNARYNQHLGEDATIMEFGATGNTLEECEVSAKYLAKVLEKITQ